MHRIKPSLPYLLSLTLLLWAVWQTTQINALAEDIKPVTQTKDALQAEQEALRQHQIQVLSRISSDVRSSVEDVISIRHDISLSVELQEHTYREAQRIDINPAILFALMERESGFDVNAYCVDTNGYESIGLCQINGIAHDFLTERGIDYTTPEGNITAACELIAYYRDERGCALLESLAAYGAGLTGMRRGEGFEAARKLLEVASIE